MPRPRTFGAALLAFAAVACSPTAEELPPYGEALLIVDTDVAVPRYASRMRLDVYTADGASWYESRDIPLRDPADWPASLSLYSPDLGRERVALVRVRIYPEGALRDYHGERFTSRAPSAKPSELAVPARPTCAVAQDCELPRLMQAGVDVTPASEPQPTLTIDRLLRVPLTPGARGSVRLTMRGRCIGTMADLAQQQTCVDTDAVLVPATEVESSSDLSIPPALSKDFGAPVECPASATPRKGSDRLYDEELCVPGGTFVLGNADNNEPGAQSGIPQRVATLPPFYLDKYEVTVGRFRDAIARGFAAKSLPIANETALSRDTCTAPRATSETWCTYSAKAGAPEDREKHPLSCISWETARAFCRFEGGDLPTEAQWEYVAQVFGRDHKTTYPWGDSLPTCVSSGGKDVMVYARLWECSGSWYQAGGCIPDGTAARNVCGPGDGFAKNCGSAPVLNPRQGPQPVDAADFEGGDRSLGLGVVNLGGGLQEYTLDSLDSFGSRCWSAAPMVSPSCLDPSQSQHTLRGESWAGVGYASNARRALLAGAKESNLPEVGFRCARAIEAP